MNIFSAFKKYRYIAFVVLLINLNSCCNDDVNHLFIEKELKWINDSLDFYKTKADSIQSEYNHLSYYCSDWPEQIRNKFNKIGINSKSELTELLFNTDNIVPQHKEEPIMRIWDIKFIADKWIFANCTDGNLDGFLLLDFTINPDSTINWKVLNYYDYDD